MDACWRSFLVSLFGFLPKSLKLTGLCWSPEYPAEEGRPEVEDEPEDRARQEHSLAEGDESIEGTLEPPHPVQQLVHPTRGQQREGGGGAGRGVGRLLLRLLRRGLWGVLLAAMTARSKKMSNKNNHPKQFFQAMTTQKQSVTTVQQKQICVSWVTHTHCMGSSK